MSQEGAEYQTLCADLAAEEEALDEILAGLDAAGWSTATPAAGWDVRDQVGHLATSEELATVAATDPDAFERELARMLADLDTTERDQVAQARGLAPADVLQWWRDARAGLLKAMAAHAPGDRILWAAGPMSASSFVTARLMETWAHGQDIVDGLGIERSPTNRLRHVASLGVRTRGFSYRNRGLPVPADDVRVELEAPEGPAWSWGESVTELVSGTALDFCLVVTRRRRPSETRLAIRGDAARDWMDIAQAFAGPPPFS